MDYAPHFNNVTIIGLGLIGGSIAKDLRAHNPEIVISAIDNNPSSINEAISDGIVNHEITYREIGRTANLIILASPLDVISRSADMVFNALLHVNHQHFDKYIIIDTASVKAPITQQFEKLSSTDKTNKVEFLATHPMAGTEYSGFKHARKDLFRNKPWVITPHHKNSPETIKIVSDLFRNTFGSKVRQIDAIAHDEQAGLVSHSVIMLSNLIFDYIATNHPEALELAGDGFISTTRLASGNPDLHRSIIMENSKVTFKHLQNFSEFLEKKIEASSKDANTDLLAYFQENMNRRNAWLRRRK